MSERRASLFRACFFLVFSCAVADGANELSIGRLPDSLTGWAFALLLEFFGFLCPLLVAGV